MGKLNTKRLMKQCRQIAARQEEEKKPKVAEPEPIIEEREVPRMNTIELERYLTDFLLTAKDAMRRYEEAVAAEIRPNEAIQDILHAAEFAPSTLENIDLISLLHNLRIERRVTKQELEVTRLFQEWAEEQKVAINKLENTLGAIRKVLKWQPNAYYLYKTDTVGEKGKTLVVDEPQQEGNNEAEIL